jgi:hypothetical protein
MVCVLPGKKQFHMDCTGPFHTEMIIIHLIVMFFFLKFEIGIRENAPAYN